MSPIAMSPYASYYDVILIMTSFAAELATPSIADLTAFNM